MAKNCVTELAISGGTPLFEDTLHVGRPNIGSKERFFERVDDLLERRWLSNNGPYVREFESRLTEITGARNCIAMCNGTVALEVAARALGLSGEVIVPSFTFVATAHSLQWQEITPVFCDISPDTHSIDPGQIEKLITPKTTGIVGVHLWGVPCDTSTLEEIARQHSLKLMFDASHAMGVSHLGTRIGNFGHAEVFSFHATKFVNCFEGGAIVTNDDEMAQRIRLMKNFGFSGLDNVIYLGINGKMSEPSAAMGLTSLESMDGFIANNRANYKSYRDRIRTIPGCKMMEFNESEANNYQYIVLEIEPDTFGLSRDQLMKLLHAENIRARRYFYPGIHNMEPYRSYFPNAKLMLPETEKVAGRVLLMPTGTAIGREEIRVICDFLQFVHENSGEVSSCIDQIGH